MRPRLDALLVGWDAEPTGEVWTTASSWLAAGVRGGVPVILKVARIEEEARGGRLLAWWSAHGGLPVLEHDADAVLMARATGTRDLVAWSAAGRDDAAVDALVDVVLRLHAMPAPPDSIGLVPLRSWFADLVDRPQADPLLDRVAALARDLLTDEGPVVALHGDVHHGNVLDLGGRWVAIDPKGLAGHPAFDLANLFCNPTDEVAVERVTVRFERIAERARLPREVLAGWVVAWCGLSLAWSRGVPDWHDRAARTVATRLLPHAR